PCLLCSDGRDVSRRHGEGFFQLPCCEAGLDCRRLGNGTRVECCVPDGATCTGDTDCCTNHCTGGVCDACKTDGASCTTNAECCSPLCLGGVCVPCQH